ncbi:MAG: formate dehydrogenase accessory sulfurtransferase FdhD [Alphaproteobacteria bacterium]|nr:formate dehydrogenase accessory sulfurtransferase FdhD [Alphaproteobacteria bacterium]
MSSAIPVPSPLPTQPNDIMTRRAISDETLAPWHLVAESPVALLFNGEHFGVMMLTPGDLEDFAMGFALNEAIVDSIDDIDGIRVEQTSNGFLVNIIIEAERVARAHKRRRSILGGSACGICGANTIEVALPRPERVRGLPPTAAIMAKAIGALPRYQPGNAVNRSTHAAAFASTEGKICLAREDIGRHNALDKLAGAMAKERLNPEAGFVVLSSRISVELVMKTARMGVPALAAVSAPSDLALAKAGEAGLLIACRMGAGVRLFEPGLRP